MNAELVTDDWRAEAWNQFRRADAWMRLAKSKTAYARELEGLADLLSDVLIAAPIHDGQIADWLINIVVPAHREWERLRGGAAQSEGRDGTDG